MNIIAPQARPIDVLITALRELHIRKTFEMVEIRSNMQLADLNSKPRGRKILKKLIDSSIGDRLYPIPGSVQYKLLFLGHFHGPTCINCDQKEEK